jgi:hypothetical protein
VSRELSGLQKRNVDRALRYGSATLRCWQFSHYCSALMRVFADASTKGDAVSVSDLDELLDRMPQIAKTVELFSSEVLQSEAFGALIAAFGRPSPDTSGIESDSNHNDDADGKTPNSDTPDATPAAKKTAAAKKSSGSKPKASFTIDKELDLVGGGSQSFKDFHESKKPKSVVEKCLISVYWLTRIATSGKPATVDQVYTCFKDASWAVPSDLVNTLQQAGTKGWLDSKKREDLKVVVPGENYVELQMPAKIAD